MLIKNVTDRDLFLPIVTKIGITLKTKEERIIDDKWLDHRAVVTAKDSNWITINTRGAVEVKDLVKKFTPAEYPLGSTLVIAHGLGYLPLVQVVDADDKVIQDIEIVHKSEMIFEIQSPQHMSIKHILYV